MLSVFMISFGAMANDIEDSKSTTPALETNTQDDGFNCCTATLYYNGEVCDTKTICSDFPAYDNCMAAKAYLKFKNPEADI